MEIQVIESPSLDKPTEWGISFTCNNPEAKDYFKMPDSETAFRLKKRLDNMLKNIFKQVDEYDNFYGLIDKNKLVEVLQFALRGNLYGR